MHSLLLPVVRSNVTMKNFPFLKQKKNPKNQTSANNVAAPTASPVASPKHEQEIVRNSNIVEMTVLAQRWCIGISHDMIPLNFSQMLNSFLWTADGSPST